ncbi:MAG TPA: DUF6010 family protein [Chryseolinea sp.]|nr:DUF6010 family protein [Chryseolinea sp.]
MIPVIIGIGGGLLTVSITVLARRLDKAIFYGLILSGIGFLYVGFTWTDTWAFLISAAQAILFLSIAWCGIAKKNLSVLAFGYFLHGAWDLVYGLFPGSDLTPPHYDLFCLSFDFVIGFYLLFARDRPAKG